MLIYLLVRINIKYFSTSTYQSFRRTFDGDGEDSGWDTHGFSEVDHIESGVAECRRGVGHSQGISSAGRYGNPVGYYLHRKKTGDGVTLGGDFRDVRKGGGLLGERLQEGRIVVSRGNGDTA